MEPPILGICSVVVSRLLFGLLFSLARNVSVWATLYQTNLDMIVVCIPFEVQFGGNESPSVN